MSYRFSAYKRKGNGFFVFILSMIIIATIGIVFGAIMLINNNDDNDAIKFHTWQIMLDVNSYKANENFLTEEFATSGYTFKYLPNNFDDESFLRFKVEFQIYDYSVKRINKYLDNLTKNLQFNSTDNYSFIYHEDGFYYLCNKDGNPCVLKEIKSYYFGDFELFNANNIVVPQNTLTLATDGYNEDCTFTLNFQCIEANKYVKNKNLTAYKNAHNYFLNKDSGTLLPLKIENGVVRKLENPITYNEDGEPTPIEVNQFNIGNEYKIGEYFEDDTHYILTGSDLKIYEVLPEVFKDVQDRNFTIDFKNIEYVGASAFENCTSLSGNLKFDNCLIIDDNAFKGCVNVNGSIKLGGHNITLGKYAFNQCKFFGTLDLSNVDTLAEGCFYQCEKFTSLIIGENITALPLRVFSACYQLTNMQINGDIERVDLYAFYYCQNLKGSFDFSKSIFFGTGCFAYCGAAYKPNVQLSLIVNKQAAFQNSWNVEANATITEV